MNEVQLLGVNSVIDMCCGTGNQIKYLKNINITKLIGIDISENMLARASKNGVSEFCQNKDATNTEFPENSYELALLSFVLHETSLTQAKKIIDEAIRIVEEYGKIIIVDYVFDKESKLLGKWLSIITEWLIGGEHYKNFTKYINQNLLKEYTQNLKLLKEYKYIFNSVRIQVYSKY
ncbi:MAG: class I SAM-dependent methyltransferase [Chlorobi bacterium]|nr:class I SAM-dependent methyltransferase [Chlorobiota bacterium]